MSLRIIAGILVLTVAIACGSPAQEVKKETKPAVANQAKPQVKKEQSKDVKKPPAPPTMKFVACGQAGCGFWAKSHSAKELRYVMKRHAKKYHKTELTLAQLKAMVKKLEGK